MVEGKEGNSVEGTMDAWMGEEDGIRLVWGVWNDVIERRGRKEFEGRRKMIWRGGSRKLWMKGSTRNKGLIDLFLCYFILYRPVVTICITSLTFKNSTFCPHSVFMCFVWI